MDDLVEFSYLADRSKTEVEEKKREFQKIGEETKKPAHPNTPIKRMTDLKK